MEGSYLERSLRINGNNSRNVGVIQNAFDSVDRSIRVDDDAGIGEAVDRLHSLKSALNAKAAAYKAETEDLEFQSKELEKEIRVYAEEHGKKRISGTQAVVEFSPRISRSIESAKFLAFLRDLGKTNEFWKFVKIQIGDATKQYGEAVLESADVLKTEISEYGNMKIRQRGT
jgi:hypothetical protein